VIPAALGGLHNGAMPDGPNGHLGEPPPAGGAFGPGQAGEAQGRASSLTGMTAFAAVLAADRHTWAGMPTTARVIMDGPTR
jgi:hypothetical protein